MRGEASGEAVVNDTPAGRRGRRAMRAMLAAAAEAETDAKRLAEIEDAARAEVVTAFEAVRERQVRAATEKMSIEAIRDIVGDRPRLSELPANGYFTVADVLR